MAVIVPAGRQVRKYLSWTINASLDSSFGDFDSPDTSWVDDIESVDKAARKAKEATPEVDPAQSIANMRKPKGSLKLRRA